MRFRRRRRFGELSAQTHERELSFEELLDVAKNIAADMAEGMQPEDDWEPTLIVSGRGRSVSIHLDSRLEAEELLNRAIPAALEHYAGHRHAFFVSSWQRWNEADSPVDSVLLLVAEEDREEAFFARVERNPAAPPKLGAWEPITATIRTDLDETHDPADVE